jgi:AraC-like DNA-binding protein
MKLRAEAQVEEWRGGSGKRSIPCGGDRGGRHHNRYHNTNDQDFLIAQVVRTHLGDETFDTAQAAFEMSMSRMHLHRKLRALTGSTTRQFITSRRLEEARTLLGRPSLKVSDVAGRVGFRSASYFARAFARAFGVYPSEFARRAGAPSFPLSEGLPPSVVPTGHQRQDRYLPFPATTVGLPR